MNGYKQVLKQTRELKVGPYTGMPDLPSHELVRVKVPTLGYKTANWLWSYYDGKVTDYEISGSRARKWEFAIVEVPFLKFFKITTYTRRLTMKFLVEQHEAIEAFKEKLKEAQNEENQ